MRGALSNSTLSIMTSRKWKISHYCVIYCFLISSLKSLITRLLSPILLYCFISNRKSSIRTSLGSLLSLFFTKYRNCWAWSIFDRFALRGIYIMMTGNSIHCVPWYMVHPFNPNPNYPCLIRLHCGPGGWPRYLLHRLDRITLSIEVPVCYI